MLKNTENYRKLPKDAQLALAAYWGQIRKSREPVAGEARDNSGPSGLNNTRGALFDVLMPGGWTNAHLFGAL